MKARITRTAEQRFSVETDVLMSDGSYRSDFSMALTGSLLKSVESRGDIRIGGLMKITLGPVSLAAVNSLQVGESVTV